MERRLTLLASDDPVACSPSVFVVDDGDLFEQPDAFIARVFAYMAVARQHHFLVYTRHVARARVWSHWIQDAGRPLWEASVAAATDRWMTDTGPGDALVWPPPHVTLGTCASDAKEVEARLTELLRACVAHRTLRLAPLVGPVDLSRWLAVWEGGIGAVPSRACATCGYVGGAFFDGAHPPPEGGALCEATLGAPLSAVTVAGEIGAGARPCRLEWIRTLAAQCHAAKVRFSIERLGSRVTTLDALRFTTHDPAGADPADWPDDLRPFAQSLASPAP